MSRYVPWACVCLLICSLALGLGFDKATSSCRCSHTSLDREELRRLTAPRGIQVLLPSYECETGVPETFNFTLAEKSHEPMVSIDQIAKRWQIAAIKPSLCPSIIPEQTTHYTHPHPQFFRQQSTSSLPSTNIRFKISFSKQLLPL